MIFEPPGRGEVPARRRHRAARGGRRGAPRGRAGEPARRRRGLLRGSDLLAAAQRTKRTPKSTEAGEGGEKIKGGFLNKATHKHVLK